MNDLKRGTHRLFEPAIAAFALLGLLGTELMLSLAVPGSTYRGPDGGMIQSTVLTAWKFGGIFEVTNINPLQGIGSQLLPKNAWANPAFWPFAVFARETAADLSSVVALGCYATACYIMARCFDVAVLPSALAAQLCILLFAPAVLIIVLPLNFGPTPADAVTYAPYMIALGFLARLGQGSWRQFALVTIGIVASLFYSVYCDPGFTLIPAVGWAVAFATVTFWPSKLRHIVVRVGALACSFSALLVSGVAVYLYTLSQYSTRGQYSRVVDRIRILDQASALYFSDDLQWFYLAFALGWLAGLVMARGRVRVLVSAAALSWCFYVGYALVYLLLLDAAWLPPQPIYVEQCLFVLWMTGAVAGAWSLLQRATRCLLAHISFRLEQTLGAMPRLIPDIHALRCMQPGKAADAPDKRRPNDGKRDSMRLKSTLWHKKQNGRLLTDSASLMAGLGFALAVTALAIIPGRAALFALRDAAPWRDVFHWPWADEPELVQFLTARVGLRIGAPFRGSVNFLTGNEDGTIDDVWGNGIPTINEYSQTASAPSLYFLHALLKPDVRGMLNRFEFNLRSASLPPNYWMLSQLLGVRYAIDRLPYLDKANEPAFPFITIPYHVPKQREPEPPGPWYVYELPRPNLGDYSPTEVMTAETGEQIAATLSEPGFDFTRRVVLTSKIETPLIPARDMRLSIVRDGLHFSGRSDGTSVVVLPQQFSHCLRATDRNIRLVRADLLLTGVVFSSQVDSDISFDYGLFSPWCRLADLADIKSLDMKIDLHRAHLGGGRLFPDWPDAFGRLQSAARHLRHICRSFPLICSPPS